jgi:spermidine/putrescine transport system ATP-binding protein
VRGAEVLVETTTGASLRGVAAGGPVLAAGDAITVFVRPGSIAVARTAGAGTATLDDHNRIDGNVESVLFNGADSRVLVQSQAGQMIEAALPQTGVNADLRPGDQVALTWPCEHTKCFRDGA